MDPVLGLPRVMSQIPHIAVVDDEKLVREMVGDFLLMRGYTVSLCESGASLDEVMAQQKPDLIVLDLRLTPPEDGFSLIRNLKRKTGVPIIVYTANEDRIDRVIGLEIGADDYVAKHCDLRELLARIRLVLGRSAGGQQHILVTPSLPKSRPPPQPTRIRFGTRWLDHETRSLWDKDGNERRLAHQEYTLLKAFADHPGRVLSRERLLALSPARDKEPFDRSIDVRIMRLRREIEPNPDRPRIILSVRGVGYRFCPSE